MRFAANRRRRLTPAACTIAASVSLVSCGRAPAASPPVANAGPVASASPAAVAGTVPHGDHNPRHGGVVLMKGDLHYEVVLDPAGRAHHLYFTDAVREDLPASVASDVGLTIRRPSLPDEHIVMQIDGAGESWVGSGRAMGSQAATTVRVAFSIAHEPYWIDIPFTRP
jgi:hypothetical protein